MNPWNEGKDIGKYAGSGKVVSEVYKQETKKHLLQEKSLQLYNIEMR